LEGAVPSQIRPVAHAYSQAWGLDAQARQDGADLLPVRVPVVERLRDAGIDMAMLTSWLQRSLSGAPVSL
jgi:hypothetical protein